MERVIFIVEATSERIPCLLNPESLEFRRESGVRSRADADGTLSGVTRAHDPLLATGGGRTELQLDLLFDVELTPEPRAVTDVREHTARLWELSEGRHGASRRTPPVVRFIWGKAWNIPTVIVAMSERMDRFRSDGVPTRSWLRVLLVQVEERAARQARSEAAPPLETPLPLPESVA